MIFFLRFLLSWCSGLLMLLLAAFACYDFFSIVDITSFAVFTLAGSIIAIPLLYLATLKFLSKKITGRKQFAWFPLILVLIANLPVYVIIGISINRYYGQGEALLFFLAFITIAAVFGLSSAFKNNFHKKT